MGTCSRCGNHIAWGSWAGLCERCLEEMDMEGPSIGTCCWCGKKGHVRRIICGYGECADCTDKRNSAPERAGE